MGKAPDFLKFLYEAYKLSSRYSFSDGARERPVRADFHGSLDIEVFELFFLFRTHNATDRNFYKMVQGERTHEPKLKA